MNCISVVTEQPALFSIKSYAASVFTLHLQLCCINSQSQLLLCSHGYAPVYVQMLWIACFPTFCEALEINPRRKRLTEEVGQQALPWQQLGEE